MSDRLPKVRRVAPWPEPPPVPTDEPPWREVEIAPGVTMWAWPRDPVLHLSPFPAPPPELWRRGDVMPPWYAALFGPRGERVPMGGFLVYPGGLAEDATALGLPVEELGTLRDQGD